MKPTSDARAPLEVLVALLVALDLTTLARRLRDFLAEAEGSSPSYPEFLRAALEVEQAARYERKIQRRIRWSKLGGPVSLDDFDFSARPDLSPQAVKELATCRFVEERRNLILIGRPSTGKTTVARAIGHAACRRAMSVYYVSLADMLETLHAAKADGTYRKTLRRLTQPSLLILDDVGLDAKLTAESANEFFRLVCARYRQRSTIVAANLPFKHWGEFLPSPAQAVATADRLIDRATVLRFSGKPFRLPKEILGAPLDDE